DWAGRNRRSCRSGGTGQASWAIRRQTKVVANLRDSIPQQARKLFIRLQIEKLALGDFQCDYAASYHNSTNCADDPRNRIAAVRRSNLLLSLFRLLRHVELVLNRSQSAFKLCPSLSNLCFNISQRH